MHPLLALWQRFIQFYKLYLCSVPVAIEHWLCDALYVSPTIAYLVSMARSQCVNLNLGADPARKFRGGDFSNIWQSSLSWQSCVVFRIVQNHGEKSYFCRF